MESLGSFKEHSFFKKHISAIRCFSADKTPLKEGEVLLESHLWLEPEFQK